MHSIIVVVSQYRYSTNTILISYNTWSVLFYCPTNISNKMSNSQGRRREIIPLDEFPRSSTPEPSPKKQRTSSIKRRRQDPESLGRREQWKLLSLRESRTPLGGRAIHLDTGRKEEWNERKLHEQRAPLRGRATHLKTGRLRQKWIRRRRLSKIHLHESMTPLRGQASRRIVHWSSDLDGGRHRSNANDGFGASSMGRICDACLDGGRHR
jgi:hypothetical protein